MSRQAKDSARSSGTATGSAVNLHDSNNITVHTVREPVTLAPHVPTLGALLFFVFFWGGGWLTMACVWGGRGRFG